jgi:hypothetical protein
MFILASTTLCFAQLKEVKGVTNQVICYENCEKRTDRKKTYGFEFENQNNFSITIEAECWRSVNGQIESSGGKQPRPYIFKTITFIMKAGETYIWKTNLNYSVNYGFYYVVFRAYKNED